MKICVLIKQVPDKNASLSISENQYSLETQNITWVSNESDNYALEEALLIKEKSDDCEVSSSSKFYDPQWASPIFYCSQD